MDASFPFRTLTEIADDLRVARHQVQYVAGRLRVHPAKRIGRTDLYDAQAVQVIRAEVRRISLWRDATKAVAPAAVAV